MSEDDPEDPFEQLDVPEDREGDPFEDLAAPSESDDGPPSDAEDPMAHLGPDAESRDADETTDDSSSPSVDPTRPGEQGKDGPFADVSDRGGDPFGDAESVFESVDVGSVDPDEVWASLGEDESPTSHPEGTRYADVSKHRYCEQCEYFSGPPEVHCTHEDTEILEFLDMETVRLLNCPVVAEQRELGNEE